MLNYPEKVQSWLLNTLNIQTSLFHLGHYCGNWSTSLGGHGKASFHLILKNSCHLHLLEEDHFIYLNEGDAIFLLRDIPFILTDVSQAIPPDIQHLKRQEADTNNALEQQTATRLACGFFQFKTGMPTLLLSTLPPYLVLRGRDEALSFCSGIFKLIEQEARHPLISSNLVIERLTSVLFFYIIRHLMTHPSNRKIRLFNILSHAEMGQVVVQLIAHPEQDWELDQMANVARMSRASFSKKFTDAAGFSPTKFLLYYRVQLAEQLLSDGENIADVAEKVGYKSIAAFSRAFYRITAQQPGAYRKQSNIDKLIE
jgi:AraC family transcriptional activator of mtrCDE